MSRADLQTLCDALEVRVPHLLAQHRHDEEFWGAFGDSAQEIGRQAFDEEEEAYVASRVDAMLAAHSLEIR
ncbi:MAG: hypothetical protein ABWY94_11230 [Pseudoxanthomonas sp.]